MKKNNGKPIIILGAGPAGALAATLLVQKGHSVVVLEQAKFPRFSIGESLLPQAMVFLEEAGLQDVVASAGFQLKDGAAFALGNLRTHFLFEDKFSGGPGTTYQVTRADFDSLLASEAERQGADFRFEHTVSEVVFTEYSVLVSGQNSSGAFEMEGQFVLDASGFGRVLPKLLGLSKPPSSPTGMSLFTHVKDHMPPKAYDRNKILISVNPHQRDIWYWLIPLSGGMSSIGVVYPTNISYQDIKQELQSKIAESGLMSELLSQAEYSMPVQSMSGYSCAVSQMHGDRFALLGNAGEFLDPVFSSGVTIALKSASLAANVLDRQLRGDVVDWDDAFSRPLKIGVDVFREFVASWYSLGLQHIIFSQQQNSKVRQMICSILAGYVWDDTNPYVKDISRLQTLIQICEHEQS